MTDPATIRKAAIQYELRRRGIDQAEVARRAAVSEGTVSKVFTGTYPVATEYGRRTRDRVEQVVAELTGLSREALFGSTAPATTSSAA